MSARESFWVQISTRAVVTCTQNGGVGGRR
jgi:hypothetical protein